MAADAAVCLEPFLSVFDIAGRGGFRSPRLLSLTAGSWNSEAQNSSQNSQHDEIRCFAVHLNLPQGNALNSLRNSREQLWLAVFDGSYTVSDPGPQVLCNALRNVNTLYQTLRHI